MYKRKKFIEQALDMMGEESRCVDCGEDREAKDWTLHVLNLPYKGLVQCDCQYSCECMPQCNHCIIKDAEAYFERKSKG